MTNDQRNDLRDIGYMLLQMGFFLFVIGLIGTGMAVMLVLWAFFVTL